MAAIGRPMEESMEEIEESMEELCFPFLAAFFLGISVKEESRQRKNA
jgi:hypothetical protein